LLPEPLVDEYNTRKEQGLTIEANDLLVSVGRWRAYLFTNDRIDISQDPWVLLDCSYSKEVGLEIDIERSSTVII
jgi:hypothetical protein